MNSQEITCLCLWNPGIKNVQHLGLSICLNPFPQDKELKNALFTLFLKRLILVHFTAESNFYLITEIRTEVILTHLKIQLHLCVHTYMYIYENAHATMRGGQSPPCRSQESPCGFQRSDSGSQAW